MLEKSTHALTLARFFAVLLMLTSCSTTRKEPAAENSAPPERGAGMTDPNTTIHTGDTLRMDVTVPGRKSGALETVQKGGNVATPDGSFIRADGVSLGQFRTDLLNLYGNIPGYEQVQVSADIDSSPYKVVRYNPHRGSAPSAEASKRKKSWEKDFWADFNEKTKPLPASQKAQAAKPEAPAADEARPMGDGGRPAATLYPRNFNAPLTLWEAIRKEGGMPDGVDPKQVHILRRDLERLTFDCSGPGGSPDGGKRLESGDVIFLVPPGAPLNGIFE